MPEATSSGQRPIVMLGTAQNTKGGISSVVNVWVSQGFFAEENILYISTHCDGSAFAKSYMMLKALVIYLWNLVATRPKLIHVHQSSYASYWRKAVFIGVAHLLRIPYIIHLHGSEFHLFHAHSSKWVQRRIAKSFEEASAVIVLSQWWQNWVRSIAPASQVHVLYNSVTPHCAAGLSTREGTRLLCLGRLGARKGTYDLLKAVARLVPQHPHLSLRLGGDGDTEEVRALAQSLGISKHVELLGWVGGDSKSRELDGADIYVLPSYNEGLPMSVLEAMAAGLPVVSTPVGGIPEAISDGVEGFLVAPGDISALTDRLNELLGSAELRQRMGRAAAATADAHFSSSVVIPKLRSLYSSLV